MHDVWRLLGLGHIYSKITMVTAVGLDPADSWKPRWKPKAISGLALAFKWKPRKTILHPVRVYADFVFYGLVFGLSWKRHAQLLLPSVWCGFECTCAGRGLFKIFVATESIESIDMPKIVNNSGGEKRTWTSRLSNPILLKYCFWRAGCWSCEMRWRILLRYRWRPTLPEGYWCRFRQASWAV